MEEKISIVIRQATNPELYAWVLEKKQGKISYVDWLTQLIKENEELKKQVVKQNDWTGMRLALRATEKNSHLTIELLNNWFLTQQIVPVASHDQKSANLIKFEQDWKDYLQELQAKRSTQAVPTLQQFETKPPLEMPPFDFGEEV